MARNIMTQIIENIMTQIIEEHKAMRDEMANMLKPGLFSKLGLTSVLTPTGTMAEVAKATVATRVATVEKEFELLL